MNPVERFINKKVEEMSNSSKELEVKIFECINSIDEKDKIDMAVPIFALSCVLSKVCMKKFNMDVNRCKEFFNENLIKYLECFKEENK